MKNDSPPQASSREDLGHAGHQRRDSRRNVGGIGAVPLVQAVECRRLALQPHVLPVLQRNLEEGEGWEGYFGNDPFTVRPMLSTIIGEVDVGRSIMV